jgi:hypothetical protein
MSEIKVNKISPRAACGTVTLGDSGDTFTIPSGATINNQGTATNFGPTGSVSWQTTVKTSGFTAVAGEGYFVDTSSGEISVNLPAGTAGAVVGFKDYLNSFDTNKLTLVQNGSDKIGGSTVNATLQTEGIAVTLVFIDSTRGWLVTDSGLQSEVPTATFIAATGGTVTTCGNFKIHTFTGPGAFCVSALGNPAGSTTVDYLVVAGGGGGGAGCGAGGGGGAGGMRFSYPNPGTGGLPVAVQSYPITVGGGGPGGLGPATVPAPPGAPAADGTKGSDSIFSTITSTGGGLGGAGVSSNNPGGTGGSGGGGGRNASSGAGNTPAAPVSQGNPGGAGAPGNPGGGGGGGHNAAGANGCGSTGGTGGAGTPLDINGSATTYAGGGGGGTYPISAAPQPSGGAGGGGKGAPPAPPLSDMDGTANTGGGGGGGSEAPSYGTPTNDSPGGSGGSGIVIIRYQFQN